jgi:hypothetical protein
VSVSLGSGSERFQTLGPQGETASFEGPTQGQDLSLNPVPRSHSTSQLFLYPRTGGPPKTRFLLPVFK